MSTIRFPPSKLSALSHLTQVNYQGHDFLLHSAAQREEREQLDTWPRVQIATGTRALLYPVTSFHNPGAPLSSLPKDGESCATVPGPSKMVSMSCLELSEFKCAICSLAP
jgi:hypothetical protein